MTSVAEISASLQAALASANYAGSTNSSQVRADLTAALNNLNTVIVAVQLLPINVIPAAQFQTVIPQGITFVVSISRATSSLRQLGSPLTSEEGNAFLSIVQNIRTQILAVLSLYSPRIPAAEAAIPGLNKFGLNVLKNILDNFIQAFGVATPASVSKNTVQEIQSSIDSAIQNSLSLVPT